MSKINLLVITPDQLRSDYIGCYGHPTIETRHIDRLASEGVRFENCYCQSPLCAPSRISFATSSYVGEHGCRNYWSTIDPRVPNLVTALKASGYRTGMFGKNHLFTYDKLSEVWDAIHEVCLGNYDDHPNYEKAFSSFEMEADHEYNQTAKLTEETMQFMRESETPFFAWVNYQDPHPAFACPKPYKSLFEPGEVAIPKTFSQYDREQQPQRNEVWRRHSQMDTCSEEDMRNAIATYMGQVRYVDDSVGRILKFLEETGLSKNTVVVFFSDHGELLGDYRMTHKLPVFYDCLAKIPVIIRHPEGRWEGQTFAGLCEEVDLTPTILEALGAKIPQTMVGRSWVSDLDQGIDTGKETILCEAGGGALTVTEPIEGLKIKAPMLPTSLGPGAMVRKADWKLSVYFDDRCELFNIAEDPLELKNRFGDPSCERIQNELTLELLKRVVGVKVRDVELDWDKSSHPVDSRFEPLLKFEPDTAGITGLNSGKEET